MVLLDSEGTDSALSEGFEDHQIFTLTVLLASVLIYNSQGVPTRHDLENLEYPFVIIFLFFLNLFPFFLFSFQSLCSLMRTTQGYKF